MQLISEADWAWRENRQCRRFHETLVFTQAGVELGHGTLIISVNKNALGKPLAFTGQETRILTLLTAAYRKPISQPVVLKMLRAVDLWNQGEVALAQIHLSHLGLPRINEADFHRLFLADLALQRGASGQDVMKALGFDPTSLDLGKYNYNPNQPRVSAGNGRASGTWGSGNHENIDGHPPSKITSEPIALRIAGVTRSDAQQTRIIPGAQYAQVSPTPIISQEVLDKIVRKHGPAAAAQDGAFTPNFLPRKLSET